MGALSPLFSGMRTHGRQLLAHAADTFDRLPARRQQRLRQAIRHHAGGTIRA